MAHIIRAFHPKAQLPEDEIGLSGLYQSVLHSKRALLLMDNAADKEQLLPLTPPSTSLVLVTSRKHFTLPGLFAKRLDRLQSEEAHALMLSIAPRIGKYADDIAKLCDYLPLALRLTASALAERLDLRPEDYLRRLRDARTRLRLIDASVKLSYELLEEEMQKLWRALSVFQGTFNREAAASVWDIEYDLALDTLSSLTFYSLLEWNSSIDRYRFHDLVRLFANTHQSEEESDVAHRRHASYYLALAEEAEPNLIGPSQMAWLDRLEIEYDNMNVALEWSSKSTEAQHALRLTAALARFWEVRGYFREGRDWLASALARVQLGADSRSAAHGKALNGAGNLALRQGDYTTAQVYHEEALAIRQVLGDKRGISISLNNLGIIAREVGNYIDAKRLHEESLVIKKELGEQNGYRKPAKQSRTCRLPRR